MNNFRYLITWGFDSYSGEISFECFQDISMSSPQAVLAANQMFLRATLTNTKVALFTSESELTRKDISDFIKYSKREEILKRLKASEVRQRDVLAKSKGTNSLNFIFY